MARELEPDAGPLAIVVVEAPIVPAGEVVSIAEPIVAWVPRGHDVRSRSAGDEDDWACVGWGAAARIEGSGARRFEQARAAADRLWSRLAPAQAAKLPFAPRVFGGFAFDAERRAGAESRWSDFGDAAFVLPETLYAYSNDRAILAAFVPEAKIALAGRRLDDLRRSLEALAKSSSARAPDSRSRTAPLASATAGDDPGERAYADMVARAVREIDRGAFAKVVLCRARRMALPSDASASRAFAHLEPRHTACARFLFAHGSARFLGATPERLVLVRGRRVLTEALAGSLPRRAGEGEGEARAELLASAKDRAEHAFVVAAIRESLAPACEALSVPDEPVVRSLPHVHHLATPIAGLLTERSHALDLAARLHPTPALCGSPKPAARAFLLDHEAQPRGWYGGGAGWFDRDGDGAFGVAIRSALVASREAWIYAGAGIVHGSDPERELAETIAKERAVREALEASCAPPAKVAPPSPEAA